MSAIGNKFAMVISPSSNDDRKVSIVVFVGVSKVAPTENSGVIK